MYVDAVNLYGWAMLQKLPHCGFRWLSQTEIDALDVMAVPDDGDDCFFVEVDLEYPAELHDLHSDYPFAPEGMTVADEMLFP